MKRALLPQRLLLVGACAVAAACAHAHGNASALGRFRIYSGEDVAPKDCVDVGDVDGSFLVESGSPDESVPLRLLQERALANASWQVGRLGGNALQVLQRGSQDYSDRSFRVLTSGRALRCPGHSDPVTAGSSRERPIHGS